MFRGFIVFASAGLAQSVCQDCAFDVTALEEFSVQYELKFASVNGVFGEPGFSISTLQSPDNVPSGHGTIAFHARNLQVKLDSHVTFPADFSIPNSPIPLGGMHLHEELHVNGATGQASFHFGSPIVNLCFQIDSGVPVSQMEHDQIEQMLQQAEQVGPALMQQHGVHTVVDGDDAVGFYEALQPGEMGYDFFDATTSAPVIVGLSRMPQISLTPPPEPAMVFNGYTNSVGDQFTVRACEIENQGATQSFLAMNPDTEAFVANRIALHQSRLQALLQPRYLNTRFNFIPLEMANLMVPAKPQCATELAQIPARASGTFQIVLGVCSFVSGIAVTFGMLRKKSVTPADKYYQVSA